jgi:hypothetical protein
MVILNAGTNVQLRPSVGLLGDLLDDGVEVLDSAIAAGVGR